MKTNSSKMYPDLELHILNMPGAFTSKTEVGPYYLLATTENSYSLFNTETGGRLWAEAKDRPHYKVGDPCLAYMGTVENLPVFSDVTNGGYLVPEEGWLTWRDDLPSLVTPIIVNGKNIMNVVGNEDGIGIMSLQSPRRGRKVTPDAVIRHPPTCDTVIVDIRVLSISGENRTVHSFRIGEYEPGDWPGITWS